MSPLTIGDALASATAQFTPLAYDALSAQPIELAGFCASTIGGSALPAARLAHLTLA